MGSGNRVIAPGARILVRDVEWLVKKVDRIYRLECSAPCLSLVDKATSSSCFLLFIGLPVAWNDLQRPASFSHGMI